MTGIGILGLGTFLPPIVRHNDWWPEDHVAVWREQRTAARAGFAALEPTSDGMARVIAAMREVSDDPFRGTVARHVMPDDMSSHDMEEQAARTAIERAGIAPGAIDVVLVHSTVPDHLMTNAACVVHRRLGLPRACLALQTEASAYSFMHQLTLAEALIASGRARHALLVQSSATSRLIDPASPISPTFGDGATAAVVGPVSAGRGIIAHAHFADGDYARALAAGVPGAHWYDPGRVVLHVVDPIVERGVFLRTLDCAREAVSAVLERSRLTGREVDFFGVHQGTPWLRRLAQDHVGLGHARSVDTYARTAYLFAASIPLGLDLAQREGTLAPDNLVVLFGGGSGMTFGATTLRWGV